METPKNVIIRSVERLRSLLTNNNVVTEKGNILNTKKDDDVFKSKSYFSAQDLAVLFQRNKSKDYKQSDINTFLRETSAYTSDIADRNKKIANLIPEINPAKVLLRSSILSPTDLQTDSLGFIIDDEDIDPEVKKEIVDILYLFFCEEIDMNSKLMDIIDECKFGSGAYPILTLPSQNLSILKSSVDIDRINGISTESFDLYEKRLRDKHPNIDNLPVFERSRLFSDLYGNSQLHIAFETLVPEIKEKIHKSINVDLNDKSQVIAVEAVDKSIDLTKKWFDKIERHIVVGTNPLLINSRESKIKNVLDGLCDSLNLSSKEAVDEYRTMVNNNFNNGFTSDNRKNISLSDTNLNLDTLPTIIDLPSDSVIPVGITKEHIGYFIIVDRWGTPLSKNILTSYSNNPSSDLINMSNKAVYGQTMDSTSSKLSADQKFNTALTVFEVTISKLLKTKLESIGINDINISLNQTINRCIFHHLLQKKK